MSVEYAKAIRMSHACGYSLSIFQRGLLRCLSLNWGHCEGLTPEISNKHESRAFFICAFTAFLIFFSHRSFRDLRASNLIL